MENELDAASGVKTDSRSSDVGVVFQINLQRRDPGFACFVCDDPIFLKVHQLSDFMQVSLLACKLDVICLFLFCPHFVVYICLIYMHFVNWMLVCLPACPFEILYTLQAVMRVVSFPSPCNKAICFVYMWMGGFSESLLLARKLSALPSKLADKVGFKKQFLKNLIV